MKFLFKENEVIGVRVKSFSDIETDLLIEKKRADVAERKVLELQRSNNRLSSESIMHQDTIIRMQIEINELRNENKKLQEDRCYGR